MKVDPTWAVQTPFDEAPVPEVHLTRAPLSNVVAQVRFPTIASISKETFISDFQEHIRRSYPVTRSEVEISMRITSTNIPGAAAQPAEDARTIWRFSHPRDPWHVALSSTSLSLETNRYSDRADFSSRFNHIIKALTQTIAPGTFDRLGVRYVDRVVSPELDRLTELVRREILGVVTQADGVNRPAISHSFSETLYDLSGSTLRARWGLFPAGTAIDSLVGALDERNWILDLDMFTELPQEFLPETLSELLNDFSAQIYRFFRWAVTPEFLRTFGAL